MTFEFSLHMSVTQNYHFQLYSTAQRLRLDIRSVGHGVGHSVGHLVLMYVVSHRESETVASRYHKQLKSLE